jgi:hypothetical protein
VNEEAARRLERRIATLLGGGTWLASAVITAGLLMPSGAPIVSAGIALFIALPILRVAVTSFELLRGGDYKVGPIALLVLVVIALGIAIGLRGRVVALAPAPAACPEPDHRAAPRACHPCGPVVRLPRGTHMA